MMISIWIFRISSEIVCSSIPSTGRESHIKPFLARINKIRASWTSPMIKHQFFWWISVSCLIAHNKIIVCLPYHSILDALNLNNWSFRHRFHKFLSDSFKFWGVMFDNMNWEIVSPSFYLINSLPIIRKRYWLRLSDKPLNDSLFCSIVIKPNHFESKLFAKRKFDINEIEFLLTIILYLR